MAAKQPFLVTHVGCIGMAQPRAGGASTIGETYHRRVIIPCFRWMSSGVCAARMRSLARLCVVPTGEEVRICACIALHISVKV